MSTVLYTSNNGQNITVVEYTGSTAVSGLKGSLSQDGKQHTIPVGIGHINGTYTVTSVVEKVENWLFHFLL
ncbi:MULTISPECIES: hypothetical protein [Bacillaceae]|uniref:Uncharacterized protein n=1 Tax=Evansella alkalicola TaxID=745819 RepID=A0ABS6JZC0_9BACI|nr:MULTISPECIES: hypothetical protein [Bacillaceae]MBU9723436.1 hypothetical protein [Bacillus alkalicola]